MCTLLRTLRFAPLVLYLAASAAVLVAMGVGGRPLPWLVLLVAGGTLGLVMARHGAAAVAEALLCTARLPDDAGEIAAAAAVWRTVAALAVPVGVAWAVLAGAWAVLHSASDLVAEGIVAPAYGLALTGLAHDALQRLSAQRRGCPVRAMADSGALLSGLSAVTVLPALAVLGLLVA